METNRIGRAAVKPAHGHGVPRWPSAVAVVALSLLYAVLSAIVIIAVFAPLTVGRYRRVASR